MKEEAILVTAEGFQRVMRVDRHARIWRVPMVFRNPPGFSLDSVSAMKQADGEARDFERSGSFVDGRPVFFEAGTTPQDQQDLYWLARTPLERNALKSQDETALSILYGLWNEFSGGAVPVGEIVEAIRRLEALK